MVLSGYITGCSSVYLATDLLRCVAFAHGETHRHGHLLLHDILRFNAGDVLRIITIFKIVVYLLHLFRTFLLAVSSFSRFIRCPLSASGLV